MTTDQGSRPPDQLGRGRVRPSGVEVAEPIVTVDGADPGGPRGGGEVAVTELFRWVYRFFYSKTVGLILILAMACYALIGSLVTQTSAAVWADPAQRESFLARAEEVYGGWTPVLGALGLFHAFTSVPFYVVVAMLALSIIACTTHRIPELWRRNRHPHVHVAPRFFDKARCRGSVPTDADQATALAATRTVLRRHRFRVLDDERAPGQALYADRHAWSGIGTVIAHLSFVIILAAFVISATFGVEEDLAVPVGGTVQVGHGTGLALTALSFSDTYTAQGRPADYVSELQLRRGDEVVAQQLVRVNSPLEYGGFRFHQTTFGIAADVRVVSGGQELFAEAVPLKWTSNDGANAVGRFDLPGTDLEVVVVLAASGRTDGVVPVGAALFEVYRGDERVDAKAALQGSAVTIEGYDLSFERERQFTGIRMRQDPGELWMWVGSALLVIGMSITFSFAYRRIWVRVETIADDVPPVPAETIPERDEGSGEEASTGSATVQTGTGLTRTIPELAEGSGARPKQLIRFGAVERSVASYQRLLEDIVADVADELAAGRENRHE